MREKNSLKREQFPQNIKIMFEAIEKLYCDSEQSKKMDEPKNQQSKALEMEKLFWNFRLKDNESVEEISKICSKK